jgi:hypothetical protein
MFWLNVIDSTEILILIGQLPEPGTPFDIIMGDRGNPNVMNAMIPKLYGVYPFKNVISAFPFPHFDILISCTCGEGIQ